MYLQDNIQILIYEYYLNIHILFFEIVNKFYKYSLEKY